MLPVFVPLIALFAFTGCVSLDDHTQKKVLQATANSKSYCETLGFEPNSQALAECRLKVELANQEQRLVVEQYLPPPHFQLNHGEFLFRTSPYYTSRFRGPRNYNYGHGGRSNYHNYKPRRSKSKKRFADLKKK